MAQAPPLRTSAWWRSAYFRVVLTQRNCLLPRWVAATASMSQARAHAREASGRRYCGCQCRGARALQRCRGAPNTQGGCIPNLVLACALFPGYSLLCLCLIIIPRGYSERRNDRYDSKIMFSLSRLKRSEWRGHRISVSAPNVTRTCFASAGIPNNLDYASGPADAPFSSTSTGNFWSDNFLAKMAGLLS